MPLARAPAFPGWDKNGAPKQSCKRKGTIETSFWAAQAPQLCIQLSMALFDRRAAAVLTTVAVFLLGGAIAFIAWKTLVVLLFALLFAYLMEPVIQRFQKRLRRRWMAVAITYLLFWGLVALFGAIAGQRLVTQARRASEVVPATLEKIESGEIAYEVGREHGWSHERQQQLHDWLASRRETINRNVERLIAKGPTLAGAIGWALLVPFLAMLYPEKKAAFALRLVERLSAPGKQKEVLKRSVQDADEVLSDYMWAQFLLSVIAFCVFIPALWLMRVPGVLLLAMLVALMEFIFVVGPMIAGATILATVIVSGKGNWLIVLAFLIVWRLVQDYVNTPWLLSAELKMPPLAIIGAVLIGGEIGGGLGMFVAVPLAAAVRLFWRRWDRYQSGDRDAFQRPAEKAA
jgi:predicted PurR-regulated permease PerM